jgi:enoyl-CoA hydratase
LVAYSLDNGVATLTLNNGKVNAVSHALITEFNAALDQAAQSKAIVIVTGQPGILSGGYDLKIMMSSPQNAVDLVTAGSTLARRMLSHPQPIIVACTGHAVAKGAFMLLSADYRIGVEGPFNIGLNEVQIGMTMHHVGIELARERLTKPAFQRSVINAEMFNPQSAVAAGFLDKVVSADQLMVVAQEHAQTLKKINLTAHKNTKLKVRKAFLELLDQAIEIDKTQSLT